jgi:N-acetylmuramoyl-L-alanine amidase
MTLANLITPECLFWHHSASNFGDAAQFDSWHKQRGWKGIGYHYVILNGYRTLFDYAQKQINQELIGRIEKGRLLNLDQVLSREEKGAHVYGYNGKSIGLCLVHLDDAYHEDMIFSAMTLSGVLVKHFEIKIENVLGHCEVDDKKPLCPGYDMNVVREELVYVVDSLNKDDELYTGLRTSFLGA